MHGRKEVPRASNHIQLYPIILFATDQKTEPLSWLLPSSPRCLTHEKWCSCVCISQCEVLLMLHDSSFLSLGSLGALLPRRSLGISSPNSGKYLPIRQEEALKGK